MIILVCMTGSRGSADGQARNTLALSETNSKDAFPLFSQAGVPSFCIDTKDAKVVLLAAKAFTGDIELVSAKKMSIVNSLSTGPFLIVGGTIGHSRFIDGLINDKLVDVSAVKNKWESFIIQPVKKGNTKLLVIAGSDRRGTAFGIFHLSRLMGVSPFIWWADAVPGQKTQLFVTGNYISREPSVKYRGIFINDEDWGLQPWAAKKMDTDIRDIGPKTYARVFELLLRLKANYIWPAMHPCTKAFYYYKENPRVADDYAIVVGSSHAEPMLRNNVFEWNEHFEKEYGKQHGEWRYDTNKEEIFSYWNDRVKQSRNFESVFTVGMRGVHDSGMPGPKDPNEKVKLLESIISDQRRMLQDNFKKQPEAVPQIFVPYKEVLSLYRRGMKLPDDITIIWPDDNHGYIRQLPDETEQKRKGGHGVYYHLSYWGSPADYLWLSSISPALIGYEMKKAYDYNARELWVFNVGDIKPAEGEMQFALDMAWDISVYKAADPLSYTRNWAAELFGGENAAAITRIKELYYRLAAAGKPEHLDKLRFTAKEIVQRLDSCQELETLVENCSSNIKTLNSDAFYELVKYPVLGAVYMNRKILYQQLALLQVSQHKTAEAEQSTMLSRQAYLIIPEITERYNRFIAKGKWNGIMSWHPRDQKVFGEPQVFDSLHPVVDSLLMQKQFREGQRVQVITAEQISNGKNATGCQLLPGVGISGAGLTPATGAAGSVITLRTRLNAGTYLVVVKCLPDFAMEKDRNLNYRISMAGDPKQTVNVNKEADSPAWKENVLQGFSSGVTQHQLSADGVTGITIELVNKNIVLSQVELYKID